MNDFESIVHITTRIILQSKARMQCVVVACAVAAIGLD